MARKRTDRQVEVCAAVVAAHPSWYRARSSGERVTLASLYRLGFLTRRAWRGTEGAADAAYEYRAAEAFMAEARRAGLA